MTTPTPSKVITLVVVFLLIGTFSFAQKFDKISAEKAAFEFNCAKEKVTVLRSAKYPGGALVVLNVCDNIVYYECMGTVCQQRCKVEPKPSDYTGAGESDGKYHKLVMDRAAVEFDTPTEVKQIKHLDGRGTGTYYLAVKGNEVIYECMGSVCNLKCN